MIRCPPDVTWDGVAYIGSMYSEYSPPRSASDNAPATSADRCANSGSIAGCRARFCLTRSFTRAQSTVIAQSTDSGFQTS